MPGGSSHATWALAAGILLEASIPGWTWVAVLGEVLRMSVC